MTHPLSLSDNTLLYLDPHTTQSTVDAKEGEPIPDSTYHTANYGRMNISGLDPSIALGFFCKDENDVDDLVEKLKKVRHWIITCQGFIPKGGCPSSPTIIIVMNFFFQAVPCFSSAQKKS